MKIINALSVDVEDYFQVHAFSRCVGRQQWDRYPLRVAENTGRVLDILGSQGISATFFILGWVAERMPGLVRKIADAGHEIACHGYGHELVYEIGPERFREDVRRAKQIIEGIAGRPVVGYRAPSYSITAKSLWALQILIEEGFLYDSSIFPIIHDVYGIPGAKRFPHEISTTSGTIREFPISTYPLKLGPLRTSLPVAGGGYLRLLPVAIVKRAIAFLNQKERQPAVVYFHPWEIDPGQPRIRAGLRSTFRHYINLDSAEQKIRNLVGSFRFSTVASVLGLEPVITSDVRHWAQETRGKAVAARH
jgi:polysaccharide deacetylase family protein (PEP-CTERM system associated)